MQVIKRLDTDERQSQIGAALNLATSTIRTILKNKGKKYCHRQLQLRQAQQLELSVLEIIRGCGSPVVKVSDHGRHVMSSSPVPPKDPPCRAAMHIKSVES
ncbi:hypothetical protein TNCV_3588561 [Trichonephila clavipes]|nr:hypothetical protein TNCV_3588561 [Trichonephila clavipes]